MTDDLWHLADHTEKGGGYFRITRGGVRVADVFPYATDADREWLIEQANRIIRHMNQAERDEGDAQGKEAEAQ